MTSRQQSAAQTWNAMEKLEPWEYDAPARLQYWPSHINPTKSGVWDSPKSFETLRQAITIAIMEKAPPANVAWIMTSGGHVLKPAEIEDLWLRFKAPASDHALSEV